MKFVFSDVVPLGSIKELPAETCGEIEASEGNQMADGKYWIYSEENSEVIEAYCKGKLSELISGLIHHPTACLTRSPAPTSFLNLPK